MPPATAVLVVVAVFVFATLGAQAGSLSLLLLAATVIPKTLLGRSVPWVGIAPPTLTLTTTVAAAALGLVVTWATDPAPLHTRVRPFLPWLAWLAFGSIMLWPQRMAVGSGTVHLAAGVAAFAVASSAGRAPAARRVLPLTAAAVALAELALFVWAKAGLPVPGWQGQLFEGARYAGTLGHPGQLGKAMVLLLIVITARFGRAAGWERRALGVGAGAAFLVTGLTLGRSSTLAALAALGAMAALAGHGTAGGRRLRQLLAWGIVAVALLSGMALWGRERIDPSGGDRGHLRTVALVTIRHTWSRGVGPNNYVAAVGQHDELVASGVPVHDAGLLAAAETGLPGTALFLLGLAAVVRGGARRRAGADGLWGGAVVGLAVALAILAFGGWGLWLDPVYTLALTVLGFLAGAGAADDTAPDETMPEGRGTDAAGGLAWSA